MLAKINLSIVVETTEKCEFCMRASAYFLQTGHKISGVIGGVSATIRVAIRPPVVE